jgi:hypothetical protein
VKTNVDALLTKVRRKYKEYGINEKPFVVVKADNGTYGMGIMTVRDAKDLDDAATAARKNKMAVARTASRSPRSSSRKACPPTSASTTPWPSRWST